MSFASETKNELARVMPEKKCCKLAEIAGFIRVSGSLRLAGRGGFKIVIKTENPAAARHYKTLIKDYFKVDCELKIKEAAPPRKGYSYRLVIDPEMRSESILRETGILMVREGNNYISDGIYQALIKTKCCRKSYLRGIFMASGTVSDPNKGYHLEIRVDSEALANDIRKLINTFDDLEAKVMSRRGKYVVYMKNSQYISDTLAIMGAHSQVLGFEDVKIKKDLVNHTMRITNCDTANADRILDAAERQIAAIRRLKESGRYKSLPQKLKDLCDLRLEHPEASLTQLGEMMDPPVKKSGVNSRMKRIEELAE